MSSDRSPYTLQSPTDSAVPTAPRRPVRRGRRALRKRRSPRGALGVWAPRAQVFFKTAGEVHMLAQDYDGGEAIIQEALRLFRKVGLNPNP